MQVYIFEYFCGFRMWLVEAGPLWTLSWHSFSHYISRERGMHQTPPPSRSKRGVPYCCGLAWETTNLKYHIPVLSGGPVCNCVLSDLQSPFHSFVPDIFLHWIYFSFFGILAAVPLVTKFSSSPPPCVWQVDDKSVWKLNFVQKENVTPILKRSKTTMMNWQM